MDDRRESKCRRAPSGVGNVNIQNQGTVYVGGALTINGLNHINLNGGTLRLNTVTGNSLGLFAYISGTVQFAGNRNIGTDPIIQTLFGAAPTIPAGKSLVVEGIATLSTATTLNGGSFSAGQLINPQLLQVAHGTLDVPNQAATIDSGGTLDLAADATINYGLGTTNHGLVTGDGQIGGTFNNATEGELRAAAGKSLTLTGTSTTNNGKIAMLGGSWSSRTISQTMLPAPLPVLARSTPVAMPRLTG